MSLLRTFIVASLALVAGCGEATDTECPPDNTLSAQNFGEGFMSNHCTQCHATALKGSARHGAPDDVNLDTLEGVRAKAKDIDKQAGASATVTNTSMPPSGSPAPTVDERRQLSQWLACGAP